MRLSPFFAFALVLLVAALEVTASLIFPPRASTAPYRSTRASTFFNIDGPASLIGSIATQPAVFGTHFPITNTTVGTNIPYFLNEIVVPNLSDDIELCRDPTIRSTDEYGQSLVGKVLLVRRGTCPFGLKASKAQAMGAAAMIIYGCKTTAPTNCAAGLQQPVVGVFSIGIPVTYIQSADGERIAAYLTSRNVLRNTTSPSYNASLVGPIVTMQTITTGPMVQSERDGLSQIISLTTMNQDTTTTSNGILRPWNPTTINNQSADPCLDRIAGIWCENGHMVELSLASMKWKNPTDGTLPSGIGAFTQMRFMVINGNFFSGPVPQSICAMTEMFDLQLQTQNTGKLDGFTSLPDCMSSMTKLASIIVNNNAITNLPDFINSTSLTNIDISSNAVLALPTSFPAWTSLVTVNVANNQLTTLPDTTGLSHLTSLSVSGNKISMTVSASFFDNLAATTLDLSGNNFHGPLPNLFGCQSLKTLIITGNSFSSSIPNSWADPTNAPNLVTFLASHNQIVSPFTALGRMQLLQTYDLSYNNLTATTGVAAQDGDVGQILSSSAGPSLVSFNVAHNNLNGFFGAKWFQLSTKLAQIFASNNQITTLPNDLFTYPSLTTLDVSNNNITSWPVTTTAPSAIMTYLNLRGNPNLVINPILFWMTTGTEMVNNPGDSFSCPRIVSKTNALMNVQVDAVFTNYNGCKCLAGTFGVAPTCYAVPLVATLSADGGFSSSEVGSKFDYLVGSTSGRTVTNGSATGLVDTSFGDSWYGDGRLTLGIQTSFVIDLTSSAAAGAAPVRFITVRLHINRDLFTHVTDVLSVYQGDASLSSTRIAAIRGTDVFSSTNSSAYTTTPEYEATYGAKLAAMPNSVLLEVDVLGSMAAVSFSSRDSSGTHFLATYSSSTSCPTDYFFDTDIQFCRANLEVYKLDGGIRAAVYAVAAVSFVLVGVTLVLVLTQFNSPVIRAASRPFLVLIIVFLSMMSLGSLLYAAVPDESSTGRAICSGRVWLSAWPLTGILAVLLAKTNRISNIFTSTQFQVRHVTDQELLGIVGVILSITTVFLSVYSGVPLNEPRVAEGSGSLAGKLVSSCHNLSGFGPWIGVLLVYIFILMIGASYLAFKTRDLPSRFNESTHMMNALFLLLFFGALIVPLDFFIQDNPDAAVLIQGIGQALMCLLLNGVIFGPKIHLLLSTGKAVEHAPSVLSTGDKEGKESSTGLGVHSSAEAVKGGPNRPIALNAMPPLSPKQAGNVTSSGKIVPSTGRQSIVSGGRAPLPQTRNPHAANAYSHAGGANASQISSINHNQSVSSREFEGNSQLQPFQLDVASLSPELLARYRAHQDKSNREFMAYLQTLHSASIPSTTVRSSGAPSISPSPAPMRTISDEGSIAAVPTSPSQVEVTLQPMTSAATAASSATTSAIPQLHNEGEGQQQAPPSYSSSPSNSAVSSPKGSRRIRVHLDANSQLGQGSAPHSSN